MNEMTEKKRPRRTISLDTKIQILDLLAKGEGFTAVANIFNLHNATIHSIKKNESVIRLRQSVFSSIKYKAINCSHSRDTALEKMEKALFTWIEDNNQKRIPVNGMTIRAKATWIYAKVKEMEPTTSSQIMQDKRYEFNATNKWLKHFMGRYTLRNVIISGKKVSAAARDYPYEFANIIEGGKYTADQVFNADETGLLWKKMPSRTFLVKSEKNSSRFKVGKDRITILFCSNASGDRILKPLLVNRSLRPRELHDVNLNDMPVHWVENKKTWLTTSLFNEWFENCFVKEVKQYLEDKGLPFKALLLLNCTPGHIIIFDHPNIQVVFLPPNTTSVLQPLDQGIISTFKAYYVLRSFKYIKSKMEYDETLTVADAWQLFSIIDCINISTWALSEIKNSTLNECWKNVWPKCVKNKNSPSNTTDNVYAEIITMGQTVGIEGFNNLSVHDLQKMMVDRALNEEELLEIALEQNYTEDCSEEDEKPPLTASLILEGIQMADELANHFVNNDPMIDEALRFQSELNACMAHYKEQYNKLSKLESQRWFNGYTVNINQPAIKNEPDDPDYNGDNYEHNNDVQLTSDENTDFKVFSATDCV